MKAQAIRYNEDGTTTTEDYLTFNESVTLETSHHVNPFGKFDLQAFDGNGNTLTLAAPSCE